MDIDDTMQITVVEFSPTPVHREFEPGEREFLAWEIRESQRGIRHLRRCIANGETDVSSGSTIIEYFRKVIADRRETLGLRPWK